MFCLFAFVLFVGLNGCLCWLVFVLLLLFDLFSGCVVPLCCFSWCCVLCCVLFCVLWFVCLLLCLCLLFVMFLFVGVCLLRAVDCAMCLLCLFWVVLSVLLVFFVFVVGLVCIMVVS